MKSFIAIGFTLLLMLVSFNSFAADEVQTFSQYTDGEARAADSQNHEAIQDGGFLAGGFETGFAVSNYYASDPDRAEGAATAEVISTVGESFLYDNGMGGESHSVTTVKNMVNTTGDWGKGSFEAGAEQGSWVTIPGELEFGYAYNNTSIQNDGVMEANGPISLENQTMAAGHSIVELTSTEDTRGTEVSTWGETSNSFPGTVQSTFTGSGGFGGGNTLIKGNAAVQGQFSGTFETMASNNMLVQGSGSAILTNGFQEGIGQVVRAEVNSMSTVGQ